MEQTIEFHHRWWHYAGLWFTVTVSAVLGATCTYAALFAPPAHKDQWIPLTALVLFAWGSFVYCIRARKVLGMSYQATSNGIRIEGPNGLEVILLRWNQVIEVHQGSDITGFGYIRGRSFRVPFRFCNWFGEATAFVQFSIQRCIEENGA